MPASRSYDPLPSYRPVAGEVAGGWSVPAADLPLGPLVLAVDGPAALDWAALADGVADAVRSAGRDVDLLDVRDHYAAAADERVAAAPVPAGDPFFTPLSRAEVADLFDAVPRPGRPGRDGVTVVYGPGAALCAPDVLWYADLPKRYAEAAVAKGELPIGANLGRPGEPGDLVRLFYTDWPVLDRHRDAIAGRVDRWIDVQDTARPASLDGAALRGTLAHLARGPVRTRPYFNSTPWGGQWAASELGFTPRAGNTALGYELIAPEAGVLVGEKDGPRVELPFQLLCVQHPREMLGEDAHRRFGTSFPIRFDYLDTVGGGNLSLHLHPREQYMREVFGWPYTQHETYYVTAAEDGARVLLGLTEQADVDTMRRQVEDSIAHGTPVPVEDHVQSHPATVGQLFMIPAGTPHASGAGNLVLEVSATPYLYSLRLYDWLRKDARGASRPLPHRHGFANLDTERRGEDVTKDLVQQPRTLRDGEGWREEVVGALPEMFYAVHRLVVAADTEMPDDTAGRFHILNVAAGEGAVIETDDGRTHTLAFAETLTVPAAVGAYRVRAVGGEEVRIVKALVVEP
ncbi:class I mannose-6-phosphate isomerase [Streptomyces sp. STCH 565 A]|uniref:class I mannose-6-phosphate isomerase n=1 Tax=Streptomyces sp. STCH 565 A TaxID=2950532 RepID=UPI002075339E|nr:class I mannose-6-phosphate isomerase [Streptomyces sp. STCH 565 A]MCM8551715.1 class I mannose-6-phosphate isomerase [Streptomyces sp. STCH 565 A]